MCGGAELRRLPSVALHGDGRSSGAVVASDLVDHQQGDQQAHQLPTQVAR